MKNLIRIAIAVAIILPLLGLADHFWLKPQVEEQIRASIEALNAGSDASRKTTVASVEFKSFTGRLYLRGVHTSLQGPQGPVQYDIGELSLKLPFAVTLLYTPLQDLLLPEQGPVTVAEDVQVLDVSMDLPEGRASIQRKEVASVQLDSPIVRALAAGTELPPLSALGESLILHDARAIFTTLSAMNNGQTVQLVIKEIRLPQWQHRLVEAADFNQISLRVDDEETLQAGAVQVRGLRLPEQAVLDRLAALATAEDAAEQQALAQELQALCTTDKPLVQSLRLSDVQMALPAGSGQLDEARLEWLHTAPYEQKLSYTGLKFPAILLDLPPLPDLDTIRSAGSLHIKEEDAGYIREAGTLSIDDLGTVHFNLQSNTRQAGNPLHDLFQVIFKDVVLKLEDTGLMARLALLTVPEEQATENLIASIHGLVGRGNPANDALTAALASFVGKPGTLELRTPAGKQFTLLELVGIGMGGTLGQLFTATATEGTQTLQEQIAALVASAGQPAVSEQPLPDDE